MGRKETLLIPVKPEQSRERSLAEFYLRKEQTASSGHGNEYYVTSNHVPGPNEDKVPAGTPIMIETSQLETLSILI